jgi:hypothetical protein
MITKDLVPSSGINSFTIMKLLCVFENEELGIAACWIELYVIIGLSSVDSRVC